MSKTATSFVTLAAAIGFGVLPAQAELARTFVSSVNGNDGNDCNRLTPCRTFQAAHDKTFDQGEITVLDPGGYGAVTIGKSISIVNDGVGEAGVLVSGGANGITIAAPTDAYVSLRGLTIQGIGFGGGTGLRYERGFALTLTNCVIRNLTANGIDYLPSAANDNNLVISNTLVADNGINGIFVRPNSIGRVRVLLNRVEMYNNTFAGFIINEMHPNGDARATVLNSVAAHNGDAGFTSLGAGGHFIALLRSVSSNNKWGTFGTGILVGDTSVERNTSGAAANGVFTFGDNYSFGNVNGDTLAGTLVPKQ